MSLSRDFISGVSYIALAKYSGIVVQLVITSILARLITPEEFGIVAIATVMIAFFNILSDIGIGPAIIQKKDLSFTDLSHIFSFTIYVGAIMGLIFFFFAYPISKSYNNSTLISVCQLLSICVFFSCANIVPLNINYKEKNFKYISQITLGVQFISGCISVVTALIGLGLYAIVVSQLLSSLLLFICYYSRIRLEFYYKIKMGALRKIMSFSAYQFLFNIVNYFSRNLDKLLVGKYLGMISLGYYEKSYKLMLLPLQNITFVITPVMQPFFSTYQNNYLEITNKYLKLVSLLSYLAFPVVAVLYYVSDELILLLFGDQWISSIPTFRILTFTVGLQIIISTTGSIYQSINATKELFISGCWGALFMISSFLLTIFTFGTIEAVAYGYLLAQLANFVQCFGLLFHMLNHPLVNVMKVFIRPVLITLIMFLCGYFIFYNLNIESVWISLIVKLIVMLLIYVFSFFLISEYSVGTIQSILKFR